MPSPAPGRAYPRREPAPCLGGRSVKSRRTTPRLTTGIEDLAEAIRAWAKGWLPTEAAAELLISHRTWLEREDFLQVAVDVQWEPFRDRQVAAVDFTAAAEAVQGVLPCSDGERHVLLVAASIAEGIPGGLREAALCMDAGNAAPGAQAVCPVAGRRGQGVGGGGRGPPRRPARGGG